MSFCGTDLDKEGSTIGILTDNILLEIFYFYQDFYRINPDIIDPSYRGPAMPLTDWRRLMHVCQKWRQIIFDSPRRLNLQILCTPENLFKKSLGIWPDFPIAIKHCSHFGILNSIHEDDIFAALEHSDRVLSIELIITGPQLEKMATVMHKPFPVLTYLGIGSKNGHRGASRGEKLDLPSGFLGGSAPCLEEITLSYISFPTLPTLLLSAKNLVKLNLCNVPSTGYISPDAMVACVVELPRLNTLRLECKWATVRLGQRCPPPITRTVLPALTHFQYDGASQYLEDLVAQIDCPELQKITVSDTNPVVDFQIAQLARFLNHSLGPETSPYKPTELYLDDGSVSIHMYHDPKHPSYTWDPSTTYIYYCWTGQQVSYVANVLNQFSPILSTVAYLSLMSFPYRQFKGADEADWLHLLRPFSAVQTLHVSRELARHVALALKGFPAAEVLPSLRLTCLEGHPESSLEEFVAARELSDRPVIVVEEKTDYVEKLEYFVLELEAVTELE